MPTFLLARFQLIEVAIPEADRIISRLCTRAFIQLSHVTKDFELILFLMPLFLPPKRPLFLCLIPSIEKFIEPAETDIRKLWLQSTCEMLLLSFGILMPPGRPSGGVATTF
jgi:hypothetical protein